MIGPPQGGSMLDGPSASPGLVGAAPDSGHRVLLEHLTRMSREMFHNAAGNREAPANLQRRAQEGGGF